MLTTITAPPDMSDTGLSKSSAVERNEAFHWLLSFNPELAFLTMSFSADPQLELLLGFLERLAAFEVTWRLSPRGALLQHRERMVAMLLLEGTRLSLSPKESDDRHFDLEFGQENEAVEFVESLIEPETQTPVPTAVTEPVDLLV
jgi:hypothetical protein